ncbi:disulfide isomerase DsbC N-terminal domain-containing protein [Dokdonella koreensis]|uniref:Thiol:disulfide interchange protein n=1 Tax=Dokdonella koreensis DS-123 TaxID=1300342 RepID=A0A160DRY0_9GAMM|nr:thioredoxin fold domain-containing protein [Dokdonella koreensis]ANB16784.1 Disulfide bond isomerase, DsbC/G-like protein [Dokdonella koreensis DS-123]
MMRSLPIVAALAGLLPAVSVAADKADEAARAAILKLVPQATIDTVEPAPMAGFRQVLLGGQLVYVSDDGRYLMQGKLYDAASRTDLTDARLGKARVEKLKNIPASQLLSFGPDKPKYKLTIFTDIDCGYCRKLHQEVAEYNKLGIEFDYLFFPRSGIDSPSFKKAVSVWCAADKKAAFTAAKGGADPAPLTCDNPIAAQFQLGLDVGVDGTPAVYAPNGVKIGGYLPPAQMLERLQQLEAAKSGT